MSAYFIAIRQAVHDAGEMDLYRQKVVPTMDALNMKRIAGGGRSRCLEGGPAEDIIILEFPTFEEAEQWYDSPAYQDARQHRLRGATYQIFLTTGV